jgi:hypothetical protein
MKDCDEVIAKEVSTVKALASIVEGGLSEASLSVISNAALWLEDLMIAGESGF